MRQIASIIALFATSIVFTAGCNRTDAPPGPVAAPQSNTSPQATTAPPTDPVQSTPSTLTAPMPTPDVPKGATSSGPKPGQANDHSSPAFKAGGAEASK